MDYIHLTGAEDVKSAGYAMERASERMRSAADDLGDALHRHQNYLEEWIARFEAALTTLQEPKP